MNNSCGKPVPVRFIDLHRDCIDLAVNIFGYVIPTLSVFVTLMNILIIMVFVKPHMRSHATFILTLIAGVEILNIACPAVVFSYLYLRGNYKEYLTSGQIKWSYILGKICVDMFNMVSIWLSVLLAFIRCRCINSPFIARKGHSSRQIVVYVTILIIFVGFVHVPSFYIFEFKTVKHFNPITNLTSVIGALVEIEGVYFKTCSGRKLHIILETITDSLIPCAILMCCNIKILIMLRKAKQGRSLLRRKNTFQLKSNEENNQDYINEKAEPSTILNTGSTSQSSKMDADVHYNDTSRCISNISKPRATGNKRKRYLSKDIDNSGNIKHYGLKSVKLHSFCTFQNRHVRSSTSSDRTLNKLDKESERTSFLIFLVSTIVAVHELPLAFVNTYTLANYTDKPLPLSKRCLSIIILLWQFITYPAIFLIYACMCKAFRKELWKILTCFYRRDKCKQSNKHKPFPCPCSVRKRMPGDGETFTRKLPENAQDSGNYLDKGTNQLSLQGK